MRDEERFDAIWEGLEEIEGADVREDVQETLETLRARFYNLRTLVMRCVNAGWTNADLVELANWFEFQMDADHEPLADDQLLTLAEIDRLTAPEPEPEPETAPFPGFQATVEPPATWRLAEPQEGGTHAAQPPPVTGRLRRMAFDDIPLHNARR